MVFSVKSDTVTLHHFITQNGVRFIVWQAIFLSFLPKNAQGNIVLNNPSTAQQLVIRNLSHCN